MVSLASVFKMRAAAQVVPSFLCEITPFKQKFLQEQVMTETLKDSACHCRPFIVLKDVVLRLGKPFAVQETCPPCIYNDVTKLDDNSERMCVVHRAACAGVPENILRLSLRDTFESQITAGCSISILVFDN